MCQSTAVFKLWRAVGKLPHKKEGEAWINPEQLVPRQDTPSVVLSFTPDADATLQMEAGPYDAANRIGVVPSAGDICLIQVSAKLGVCFGGRRGGGGSRILA